jgi:hypothetical protein
MWILDVDRLERERRRQGMSIEELAAGAAIGVADLFIVLRHGEEYKDQGVIVRLAGALGVRPIDISFSPGSASRSSE